MTFVLLALVGLLVFAVGYRLGRDFGAEMAKIRAGRVHAEEIAACCCERERKARDERLQRRLRRRQLWKRTHPA